VFETYIKVILMLSAKSTEENGESVKTKIVNSLIQLENIPNEGSFAIAGI
jgi:hypothetical protein